MEARKAILAGSLVVGGIVLYKALQQPSTPLPVGASAASNSAVVANLAKPASPTIADYIGAAYGSAVPGPAPVKQLAIQAAQAEGNVIEGGVKQQLKGDKEIFTGHPLTGLKDVGAGYYNIATGGAKKAYNYVAGLF